MQFVEWLTAYWPSAAAWSALAALILAVIAYQQLRWNRREAEATISAANAARQSADSLMLSERAHIALEEIRITVNWDNQVNRTVELSFHNHGKTPAFAKSYTVCPRIDAGFDLVGPPVYGVEIPLHYYIMVPGQKRQIGVSGPLLATPGDNRSLVQMYDEGDHLFLYGFLSYTDVFGRQHTTAFNRRYGPPDQDIFVNAGDETFWTYT